MSRESRSFATCQSRLVTADDRDMATGQNRPHTNHPAPFYNYPPIPTVLNCIHTLAAAAFQKWIDRQVTERNIKVTRMKDTIQMDP